MQVPGYLFSCQSSEMNIEVIHSYIARSYWAENIPKALLQRAIDNSLCFGLFIAAENNTLGEQVAFARMITDKATFAYMSDVFVLEQHRQKGLSKWLVHEMMQHPELQGLRRMVLATRDAHGLYAQFGYGALNKPDYFMEVVRPDIYKTN